MHARPTNSGCFKCQKGTPKSNKNKNKLTDSQIFYNSLIDQGILGLRVFFPKENPNEFQASKSNVQRAHSDWPLHWAWRCGRGPKLEKRLSSSLPFWKEQQEKDTTKRENYNFVKINVDDVDVVILKTCCNHHDPSSIRTCIIYIEPRKLTAGP